MSSHLSDSRRPRGLWDVHTTLGGVIGSVVFRFSFVVFVIALHVSSSDLPTDCRTPHLQLNRYYSLGIL
ncbi:hypothetical protein M407DRAFT_103798 [Tulasnella calospora MUT 4182]|uniref:Uncharacterized protein n=1 Tax=Tulasnella calospora MUT 4182 TaxID=1051891 RepID=A0A0C3QE72_9AGAM|nr:hypothetical protein M407DRAFT_103798 [Tulasnella calospora MUT 4182]